MPLHPLDIRRHLPFTPLFPTPIHLAALSRASDNVGCHVQASEHLRIFSDHYIYPFAYYPFHFHVLFRVITLVTVHTHGT